MRPPERIWNCKFYKITRTSNLPQKITEALRDPRKKKQSTTTGSIVFLLQSTALKLMGKTAWTQIVLSPGRRERYINIYIYKITQHMVPNIDGAICWKHPRHGTQCVIQYPTNRNPAQSLQENAITVLGARFYNSLPKYLRDIESVKTEKFKFELDKFLELIPDEPKLPNYVTASGSSSILDHLTHLRAQGIYRGGGVPDSAMEQS